MYTVIEQQRVREWHGCHPKNEDLQQFRDRDSTKRQNTIIKSHKKEGMTKLRLSTKSRQLKVAMNIKETLNERRVTYSHNSQCGML